MPTSNWVHLENCEVMRVSEKAILIVSDDLEEATWFPLSQVSEGEKYEVGDHNITISVTEWIMKEKGYDT